MARRVPVENGQRPTVPNPDILGVDAVKLGWMAGGLAATAWVNDKFLHPFVAGVAPLSGAMGKAVDAATTFVSAFILGKGFGMIDRSVGNDMMMGGAVLGAGKTISIAIPSFSISANLPVPSIGQPAAAATKQIPAGSTQLAVSTQTQRLGVGSTGL